MARLDQTGRRRPGVSRAAMIVIAAASIIATWTASMTRMIGLTARLPLDRPGPHPVTAARPRQWPAGARAEKEKNQKTLTLPSPARGGGEFCEISGFCGHIPTLYTGLRNRPEIRVTESQILTLNERVKGFSNYLFNLSAALLAAAVARMWVKGGVDLGGLLWLAVAIGLLLLASGILYLIEPENQPT